MSSTSRFASSLSTTGTASLVQLENQILTLRSTILAVVPQVGQSELLTNESSTTKGFKHSEKVSQLHQSSNLSHHEGGSNIIVVETEDFSTLQQEYNKLMFQKHKVWSRSFIIPKAFIGLSFQVHNGSKFILLKVTAKMVGYRFGEFVPSRKVTIHKEVKKK